MNPKDLKNYDPTDLMKYFDQEIQLPSGGSIKASEIKFELYKRSKNILKSALDEKKIYVEFLMLKFNSDPYKEEPFSKRILKIMDEGTKIYLEFLYSIKDLVDRNDPVVLSAIKDLGQKPDIIKHLTVFFETCEHIVEVDKEKHKRNGWGY